MILKVMHVDGSEIFDKIDRVNVEYCSWGREEDIKGNRNVRTIDLRTEEEKAKGGEGYRVTFLTAKGDWLSVAFCCAAYICNDQGRTFEALKAR